MCISKHVCRMDNRTWVKGRTNLWRPDASQKCPSRQPLRLKSCRKCIATAELFWLRTRLIANLSIWYSPIGSQRSIHWVPCMRLIRVHLIFFLPRTFCQSSGPRNSCRFLMVLTTSTRISNLANFQILSSARQLTSKNSRQTKKLRAS